MDPLDIPGFVGVVGVAAGAVVTVERRGWFLAVCLLFIAVACSMSWLLANETGSLPHEGISLFSAHGIYSMVSGSLSSLRRYPEDVVVFLETVLTAYLLRMSRELL